MTMYETLQRIQGPANCAFVQGVVCRTVALQSVNLPLEA